MNTNDLNTALYEKMAAEQDKYRDWLKSQPPEEVLNHAYEYTVREDIVMAMEELVLTDTQAQALLESPSPLEDVYRYFDKLETGYMDVIRDSIESRANEVCREPEELNPLLVYLHSAAYASKHLSLIHIWRDFFDLAIGNVPFGQYQVNDKAYNKLNFSIHNYFFAKSLDQVRPGGVVAFVTSRYTMDAKDSTVRRYLAQRAELLGAIRLPNDAFKKNAGAEVVSDIIFLQKRDRPLDIVPEWTQTGQTEDGFAINRYFIEHPEMVLGRQEPVSTAHGMDYTVNPIEELKLSDQLHDAVKYIHGTYQEAELPELGEGEAIDTSIPADPNVKNYSYAIVDGQVYYRENSRMVRPDLNATAEARVKGLVGLRDCVQELIDLQMDAAVPDSTIREKQAELNSLYDSFSAKYGLINDRANRLAYADDSSYYLLCALEVIDEDGKLERKADMFTKRTIKPHQAVATVDTASEALAVSISEKGARMIRC